jgi:hypothetical protein
MRLTIRTRNGTLAWRRVTPMTLTAAQLAEYAGDWYSPEIDAVWTIAADGGGLALTRAGRRRSILESAGRDVLVDRSSEALLEFQRDARGRVVALLVQAGRVRDLRFIQGAR